MILLETADMSADERVEAFRSSLLSASVPSLVTLEETGDRVRARMHRWDFGRAMFFTSTSSGWGVRRNCRYLRLEGPPIVSLALQTEGTGRFEQSGRQALVGAGELMLNDLTIPYDFSWSGSGGSRAVQVAYDVLALPPDIVRKGAQRLSASPLYDLVRAHMTHVYDRADTLSADPGIAHAHNISLRALYRLCAQAQLSLEQWIIEQRLEGARTTLASPVGRTRTIASVARAWGFTDPSHFTRRFKEAYGVTPQQWRKALPG